MTAADRCRLWPHRWYGFWTVPPDDVYPDIQDYIDPSWSIPDLTAVLNYLASAPVLFTVFTMPCILDPSHGYTSRPRTDGVWLWPDELVHYVDAHHVRLPDAMLEHIRSRKYKPPKEWRVYAEDIA